MKKLIIICSIVTMLLSCNSGSKNKTIQIEDEIITHVSEDDKDMNRAMETARASFDQFKKAFVEAQGNDQYHSFIIKIGFDSPQYGKEHMWVGDLKLKDDKFVGILSNTPTDPAIALNYGDTIVIDPAQISDWMYIDSATGLTKGAYTFRVMRDAMSEKERMEFDEQTGIKLE
ncbi:MAG: DUF2314 domain-containing protein [Dysgonomonas sp.]|nr:DUF2314 domain-containing protein [Dysgonomonas sp.]